MCWFNIGRKKSSGFSSLSTAEEVTHGIDGSNLTAIVTGASSGIGAETTRVLALHGVHVMMAVRNIAAGTEVRAKILEQIPRAKIDIMKLDLSSLASVRKFALDYNSSHLPLNLLINNAGMLTLASPTPLSQDNIELHFATNHLGHFLLTHMLLETMKNTTLESGIEGRIVNVSSAGHRCGRYHFTKLNQPISGYCGYFAYFRSKLANILHANELARRFKNDGVEITANSVHPGVIYTKFFRFSNFADGTLRMLSKYLLKDIPQGAATTCYVALHPQLKGISGEYFSNCNIATPSKQAQDITLAPELWDLSMDLIT